MSSPKIVLTPLQAGVPAEGGTLDVLVRVQAPERQADLPLPHLPKRLALVVDRSGSMSGQPLLEALRCVTHIASHLTERDSMSLVVYDDKVKVLLPLQPMKSLAAVKEAVSGLRSGGSTDLHGGWLAGAQQLEGSDDQSISRVILLSDGQANHGLTDLPEIETQCRQWLARGISTTTVGLGRHFNEDLMIGMARAGGGQNYYGQTAEDLYDNFDEELSLLQAMYLRQIGLKLVAAPGVVVEMLSLVLTRPDGRWGMTDLPWGAESWVAVRLHLSATNRGDIRDLLGASITGTTLDGQSIECSAPLLQLPVMAAVDLATLPRDQVAHNRLEELAFARASAELRALAERGDLHATEKALAALEVRFGEHPWLRAKIEQLRLLADEDMMIMAKESRYSMMRMSSRVVAKQEMSFIGDETESLEMPAFLRKKVSEGRGKRHEP